MRSASLLRSAAGMGWVEIFYFFSVMYDKCGLERRKISPLEMAGDELALNITSFGFGGGFFLRCIGPADEA